MTAMPTIHASAVLIGARAALIRGPPGAGKSRLALALLRAADAGHLRFVRLVADDRCFIETHHGRLLVRPAPALVGLIEVRGLGIRRIAYEPAAIVGLVVDLAVPGTDRLPSAASQKTILQGVELSRLAVAPDADPLPLVLAALLTEPPA
jgi:HPr kinase/phosphorylase